MQTAEHVKKTVSTEGDIEVNDVFESTHSGYGMYYVVTKVAADGTVTVVERDGLLNVGHSEERTFEASDIIENLHDNQWRFYGIFAYEGKGINGNPINYKEVLTPEAFEELKDDLDEAGYLNR